MFDETHGANLPKDWEHIPSGWEKDPLTRFFDFARGRAFASYVHCPREYRALKGIDEGFLSIVTGWQDPESVHVTPFVGRSHAAYRVATQLAMSGQLPESYMVMRGCLEYALYASLLDGRRDLWEVWRTRGDSEAARKRCVKHFSGSALFDRLRARNAGLADIAKGMYERTIDFGAHPNELAVGMMTELQPTEEGGIMHWFTYISGDDDAFRLAVRSASQTGLIVLDILCHIFPLRAAEVELQERLSLLKTGL